MPSVADPDLVFKMSVVQDPDQKGKVLVKKCFYKNISDVLWQTTLGEYEKRCVFKPNLYKP